MFGYDLSRKRIEELEAACRLAFIQLAGNPFLEAHHKLKNVLKNDEDEQIQILITTHEHTR